MDHTNIPVTAGFLSMDHAYARSNHITMEGCHTHQSKCFQQLSTLQNYSGKISILPIKGNTYTVYDVPGDGSCFFHCLSLAIHGDIGWSHMYRHLICRYIYIYIWNMGSVENNCSPSPWFATTKCQIILQWNGKWQWLCNRLWIACGCYAAESWHWSVSPRSRPNWANNFHKWNISEQKPFKIILILNNNHFNLLKTKVTTITINKLQVPTKRTNSSNQTEDRSIQSELQPIHVHSFHKEPPIKQSTLHQISGNTIIPAQQILGQHPLGLPHQLLQNDLNQNHPCTQENNNIPLPDKCILHHRKLGVPYEYPLATETNQKRIIWIGKT